MLRRTNRLSVSLAVVATFCLSSCAGVGIIATSNPAVKLSDALDLFDHQNRPLPAERLIREAIEIYQQRHDTLGLGEAYRTYGLLLASDAVGYWEYVYRRDGFLDKSVQFDQRFAKAIEYLDLAEKPFLDGERFDALTNVYYVLGWTFSRINNREKACLSFDRSMDAYRENIKRNPTAKPKSGTFATFADAIASAKQQVGCDGG